MSEGDASGRCLAGRLFLSKVPSIPRVFLRETCAASLALIRQVDQILGHGSLHRGSSREDVLLENGMHPGGAGGVIHLYSRIQAASHDPPPHPSSAPPIWHILFLSKYFGLGSLENIHESDQTGKYLLLFWLWWWEEEGITMILLLFSRQVVSFSLRPHGLQHARPPCPSSHVH